MFRILSVLVAIFVLTDVGFAKVAHSPLLKHEAARVIRKAGFWCRWVSYIRLDTTRLDGRTVLHVTCDGYTRFEQYRLFIGENDKVLKIEKGP